MAGCVRNAVTLPKVKGTEVVLIGEKSRSSLPEVRFDALVVEAESINDRVHGKGEGEFVAPFEGAHDLKDARAEALMNGRIDNERHAAAGCAAEHEEAPIVFSEFFFHGCDEVFGEGVGRPRDHDFGGVLPVEGSVLAELAHIAGFHGFDDVIEVLVALEAGLPLFFVAQEVTSRYHFKDWADIEGEAAMYHDDGTGEALIDVGGELFAGEDGVGGKEATAADGVFGIAFSCFDASDEFDAGPDTAGILPAATGATQPFAEDGAGGDEAPFVFAESAGLLLDLATEAHEAGDNGSKEGSGDGEA